MRESSLSTWKWVLAETGIVVAGILIAFSLNSWWADRSAAVQEQAHLLALHSDFKQNVERLNGLAKQQDRVAGASRDLLLIARDVKSASVGSVDQLIGEVFSSDQFDPVMGAYENLVNSGGLSQIKDEDLRRMLATFSAMVESRYAEEFSLTFYLEFNRAFMGQIGWADAVLKRELIENDGGMELPETDWNHELLADPAFQDHLALRYLTQAQVAQMYRELGRQAEQVLERTAALTRQDTTP